jgi:hypothetical protein
VKENDMTLIKTRLGTNEDGSPLWHYHQDDPTKSVVVTGPISGAVIVNGQTIDVTEAVIEVANDTVAVAVAEAIAVRHVEEGHPMFENEVHDFVHTPAVAPAVGDTPEV